MNEYVTLVEISFAARKYNTGEVVMMSPERAEKYLTKNQVKLVKPAVVKEAK